MEFKAIKRFKELYTKMFNNRKTKERIYGVLEDKPYTYCEVIGIFKRNGTLCKVCLHNYELFVAKLEYGMYMKCDWNLPTIEEYNNLVNS